ncbi:CvfB family protein [Pseudobdellovibrio exovorus]|uniref:GntR family transcriptional regulator n=1 Tax=Pseudobdellovibrio exovorus JSS TaxID=1184267 RepID=M4VS19_9BACT|nr:S1-like domain-containing RNA-binding protein [Pseudobdellovibrio exovorus]AGH95969.1 hypothetical protein A11Q_1753 [Pseudobdellovibrio exovorus JSS]
MSSTGLFAILRVVSLENIGAFLNGDAWRSYSSAHSQPEDKDLFLPFAEQTQRLQIGQEVLVYIYSDNQGRPTASMRIEKFTAQDGTQVYKVEQKVDLIVFAETDLGYKALINNTHFGLLYKNEVFRPLHYLDEISGFIRKVREDGKIDLILQAAGNKGAEELGLMIIQTLEDNNGFLPLTEKTPPEEIYRLFGVSKKKYKMALGFIYKKRLVRIEDDGLHLINK